MLVNTGRDASPSRKKLTSRDVLAVMGLLLFDVLIAVSVIGTLLGRVGGAVRTLEHRHVRRVEVGL
jgi:hypothetical protein